MNLNFRAARDVLFKAALPDRAVAGFVNAALDGSGQTSKLSATLKGLKEDAFEVAKAPSAITRALLGK